MIYGYATVSTDGQSADARLMELRAAGAEKLFSETASGARSSRLQLRRMLSIVGAGDQILVTRLDRLARSTIDLLNILAKIGEVRALFRSLRDPWADTTTPRRVDPDRA